MRRMLTCVDELAATYFRSKSLTPGWARMAPPGLAGLGVPRLSQFPPNSKFESCSIASLTAFALYYSRWEALSPPLSPLRKFDISLNRDLSPLPRFVPLPLRLKAANLENPTPTVTAYRSSSPFSFFKSDEGY